MPLSQILQTSRTNPPLNLRYTNPLGTARTATGTLRASVPCRSPSYFVGQAQVDINGMIRHFAERALRDSLGLQQLEATAARRTGTSPSSAK